MFGCITGELVHIMCVLLVTAHRY